MEVVGEGQGWAEERWKFEGGGGKKKATANLSLPLRPQPSSLFSLILLAFLDGHVLSAMLTGINLVWTEQFVLAKLFKPMGQPSRHTSQSE